MTSPVDRYDSDVLFGLIDHRLPLGVIGLDSSGKVVTQNHAARMILGRRDGLSVLQGRLVAVDSTVSAALGRLVLHACERHGDGVAAGGALEVARPFPHRPLTVLVAPLRVGDLPQASGLPSAVAFISDPDSRAQTWREVLRNLHGLTDAEADVAFLVLGGTRIKEIARRRGVSRNTVRTHLKHIFDKTNAQSQADLVRVLLSGAPGLLRVHRATPGGDDLPASPAV